MMVKCKYCGKTIDPCAMFVVEGKYPFGRGRIWWKSTLLGWVPPETYGDIYHRNVISNIRVGTPRYGIMSRVRASW